MSFKPVNAVYVHHQTLYDLKTQQQKRVHWPPLLQRTCKTASAPKSPKNIESLLSWGLHDFLIQSINWKIIEHGQFLEDNIINMDTFFWIQSYLVFMKYVYFFFNSSFFLVTQWPRNITITYTLDSITFGYQIVCFIGRIYIFIIVLTNFFNQSEHQTMVTASE